MTVRSLLLTVWLVQAALGSLAFADSHVAEAEVESVNVPAGANETAAQSAGHTNPGTDLQRPKIGLALSGGGARGAAHVGVIKVLEELRVPIDFIAGTSMGAIVGGLYASGMSTAEIEATMSTLDWGDAFQDQIDREDRSFRRKRDDDLFLVKPRAGFNEGEITLPTGLITGQKIDLLLRSLTLPVSVDGDFDELSIPFRAVATDIVTGRAVVIGSGDLALAVRASMSIPAFFTPVEIDGKLLVDGGVAKNLPVDVVRQMGADVIIAVDISTPLRGREQLTSILGITNQLTGILTRRNTEAQIEMLTADDLLIVPDLGDIAPTDFERATEIIPIGVAAARQHSGKLQQLAVSANEYNEYLASQQAPKKQAPSIDFVRIENRSRLSNRVLAAGLSAPIGEPLDVTRLEQYIGQIYGWQIFENVRYDVEEEEGGETGLVLHVDERPWGPNYLQFGLALSDDFDGDSFFNLSAAYTRTAINELGGEFRTALQIGREPGLGLEIYQPLDVGSRFFVHPQIFHQQRNVSAFDAGNILSEFRVTDYGAELGAGRNLGAWGEVRLGLRRSSGTAKVRVGDPTLPRVDFERGEAFLRLSMDELDKLDFPSRGGAAAGEWLVSRDGLGADSSFDQLRFNAASAKTWGRHTFVFRGEYGTTISGDAPVQSFFRLGGFADLSGFNENELSGPHFGL
ncbi:MAG: patatin-like phospholipase family protein [Gammaproteobacteria bacterium]